MMALLIISQIFALRWALKTKCSDFRIVPVAELPRVEEPKIVGRTRTQNENIEMKWCLDTRSMNDSTYAPVDFP